MYYFTKELHNWKKAIAKYNAIEKQVNNEKLKLKELEEKLEKMEKEYEKQKDHIKTLENTKFFLWIDIDVFYAKKHNDKEKIKEILEKQDNFFHENKNIFSYPLNDKDIYKITRKY